MKSMTTRRYQTGGETKMRQVVKEMKECHRTLYSAFGTALNAMERKQMTIEQARELLKRTISDNMAIIDSIQETYSKESKIFFDGSGLTVCRSNQDRNSQSRIADCFYNKITKYDVNRVVLHKYMAIHHLTLTDKAVEVAFGNDISIICKDGRANIYFGGTGRF